MSRRTLLRALDLSRNLHDSRSKLERVILRASRALTKLRRAMDMDEILLLLKTSCSNFIHIHIYLFQISLSVDTHYTIGGC